MKRIAQALRRITGSPQRQQVVSFKSFPAPVGGLNARDPVAQMDPRDAIVLDNWWCRVADVVIRQGCADWRTGFAAQPKSLMLYTPPTASNKMFAATNSGIFDASTAGAVGGSLKALTQGYLNWFQMGVSGGHYLCMFNGIDKPIFYEGTNFISIDAASAPAITGVTTTGLISGNVYKRRMFLIEKDKLSFWYLPIDSVGGAAAEFLLGPLCTKGGFLMAMGTWTLDGGDGPNDYAAFVTSEGQVVVFQGTDPGTAANWLLVGVYNLGAKPIGRKCFIKYAGDLVLITEFGALPLSRALQSSSVEYRTALTNKIESAFTQDATSFAANNGWEAHLFPSQNMLLFNVPTSSTTSRQYAMNTITKAWSRFTGWNATCFVVFNKELYFADQTKVAKAWTTRADYGLNIIADAKTAYNYMGGGSELHWTLYRPQLLVDGAIQFNIGLSIDFRQDAPLAVAAYSVASGAIWDTSLWDVGMWASGLEIKQDWQTPSAWIGRCAAAILRVPTNVLEVQWVANDYVFEPTKSLFG